MPIHLDPVDVASSPTAGRLIFLIDPNGRGKVAADALNALPGVTRPDPAFDLFGRGLHLIFGNYLSAYRIRGGLAALVDDDASFMRATRRLADSVYSTALSGGGRVLLDCSATNRDAPQVMQALYPDALFVIIDDNDASKLLRGPNVVRVYATDVNAAVMRAQEVLDRTDTFPARPFEDTPALRHPPIFVVGCPRSGTTWLQHLLKAHPSVAGPENETAIFVALRSLLDNRYLTAAVGRKDLVAIVRRFARELFAGYLDQHAPHATRFIEKTPMHAQHVELITELFPEAYVVGIHRDGRDVVRSVLEVEAGTNDPAVAAQAWVDLTRNVEASMRRSPRVCDERYESWLVAPVERAAKLMEWLELPVDDGVIAELQRRATERVSQYNTTGPVGEGKWRSLSEANLEVVYRVAGKRLAELGYTDTVTARGFSPAHFLRAARRR